MPLSLVWTGFVASIALTMLGSGFPFDAMILLFLGVGLYLTLGRFVVDAWIRRGTSYALTDKRALILRRRPGRLVREQPLHAALPISVKGSDRGSVTFGQPAGMMSWTSGVGPWTPDDGSFTFRGIVDPQEVYRMARGALH